MCFGKQIPTTTHDGILCLSGNAGSLFELPMWKPFLIVCVEHWTADDYLLIVAQQGKKLLFSKSMGTGKAADK